MTALAADTPRAYLDGDHSFVPAKGSSTIFEGAPVGDDGSGYGRLLVAGDPFRGFAQEQCDNSSGSDGDEDILVRHLGKIKLSVTGASISTNGRAVYASDSNTFTLTKSTNSKIGHQVGYDSDNSLAVVLFYPYGGESVDLSELEDVARGSIIVGSTSDRPAELDAKGDGKILVGDGTDLASVAVSGDITLTNAGVVALAADCVDSDEIADGAVDPVHLADNAVTPAKSSDGNALFTVSEAAIATADAVTLTTAQLLGGDIERDPAGGARTDTTPTAAEIVAALDNAAAGDSFFLFYKNIADGAETITLAGGTGVTVEGTATIAQNNTKLFQVVLDNVGSGTEAVTVKSRGTLVH